MFETLFDISSVTNRTNETYENTRFDLSTDTDGNNEIKNNWINISLTNVRSHDNRIVDDAYFLHFTL